MKMEEMCLAILEDSKKSLKLFHAWKYIYM